MIPILQRRIRSSVLLVLCLSLQSACAQPREASAWAAAANTQYRVVPNIAYGTASGMETWLDVYMPRQAKEPVPVVVHIHGGGWTGGAKEYEVPSFLLYLEMGLAVVNVEYRLARVSLAPAAVEDCRCAIGWTAPAPA